MPQSRVIGLIEIEDSSNIELDSNVDVLRRDPGCSSRLDTAPHSVYQFAVAKTEYLEADLVRLAIDLDGEHQRLREVVAEAP